MQKWIMTFILSMLLLANTVSAKEPTFDATIPVLDMNEYFDPATKDKFVKELHSALKEVGFFAVINTHVDTEVLDAAYKSAFNFFALSTAKKMKAFDPLANGQRGYVPGESAKGQSSGDFKEFYHVGRPEGGSWKNIWPRYFNLKKPLNNLFASLQEYMGPLEMAMAESIGMPSDFFTNMTDEGDALLRAIHYPATPPKGRLWAAEHTDIDLFTILPRATAEGLQVLNKEGEWIDIKVPENAFVVNGGDMLENITNGEFRSGLHRVVAKEDGYARYSMVFFVHPRSADRLDPLPGCVERTGGKRKYANATRLELLQERLVDLGLASPDMMKDLANSGLMERLIEVGRASPKAMNKLKDAGLASEAVLNELSRLENVQPVSEATEATEVTSQPAQPENVQPVVEVTEVTSQPAQPESAQPVVEETEATEVTSQPAQPENVQPVVEATEATEVTSQPAQPESAQPVVEATEATEVTSQPAQPESAQPVVEETEATEVTSQPAQPESAQPVSEETEATEATEAPSEPAQPESAQPVVEETEATEATEAPSEPAQPESAQPVVEETEATEVTSQAAQPESVQPVSEETEATEVTSQPAQPESAQPVSEETEATEVTSQPAQPENVKSDSETSIDS